MILRTMLGGLGFEVAEAVDGNDALSQLQGDQDFELSLVDWNMPEMNGLELVKAVRADASHADMKIMMVTTESEMTRVVEALNEGANEYVMKPFTKDVIVEKLKILGLAGGDG